MGIELMPNHKPARTNLPMPNIKTFGLALFLISLAPVAGADDRPNILFLMADDQRHAAAGSEFLVETIAS